MAILADPGDKAANSAHVRWWDSGGSRKRILRRSAKGMSEPLNGKAWAGSTTGRSQGQRKSLLRFCSRPAKRPKDLEAHESEPPRKSAFELRRLRRRPTLRSRPVALEVARSV